MLLAGRKEQVQTWTVLVTHRGFWLVDCHHRRGQSRASCEQMKLQMKTTHQFMIEHEEAEQEESLHSEGEDEGEGDDNDEDDDEDDDDALTVGAVKLKKNSASPQVHFTST